jgi:peroxiredoxin
VGVAWSGTDASFQEFIDKYSLTFPQISDDAAQVFTRFGVASQPALALILPDGEVQTLLGAADDTLLDSLISAALT